MIEGVLVVNLDQPYIGFSDATYTVNNSSKIKELVHSMGSGVVNKG